MLSIAMCKDKGVGDSNRALALARRFGNHGYVRVFPNVR